MRLLEPAVLTARERLDVDDGRPAPPDLLASIMNGLAVLWRWRWRGAVVLGGAVLAGLAILLVSVETYTAHATLIVGVRQPEVVTAEQARDLARAEPDIDGAIQLMKSEAALRYVDARLTAEGYPMYQLAPAAPSGPPLARLRAAVGALFGREPRQFRQRPPDPAERRLAELRRGYRIDRIGRSTLVDLAFTSVDPALAASAVNTLAAFSAQDDSPFARVWLNEQAGFQVARTAIVSAAPVPENPSSPHSGPVMGGAVLLGLAGWVTASLLAELRAQQAVLSAEGLSRRGIRALGLIPSFPARAGPGPAFRNAISSLHAALSGLQGRKGSVFLFTSALAAEGKTTTGVALAQLTAAAGRKVLLIDADLRSPMVSTLLGLKPAPGLSDGVRAGRHGDELVQVDRASGLHVMAAGTDLVRPFELLAFPCLRDLVEQWRQSYDVVLIDAPAVLPFGDARLLGALADHVVVLARWGRTSWRSLEYALQVIGEGGGRVAGVAMTRADLRALSRFGYADAGVHVPRKARGSRARSA